MTDTKKLIEEARHFESVEASLFPKDTERAVHRLADALEAAEQRADALAAVVEKVRVWWNSDEGPRVTSKQDQTMRGALATAPADALREHDAALIERLADEVHATLSDPNRKRPRDPRGEFATDLLNDVAWAVHLIREKARERREEQGA